jgi:Mor family transcriptional regulator
LIRHFPLVLSDEYFEISYEEFYEWISKNDEVQAFLMEFFDIQTRYNAMKAYIKYLSEFENIFDSHVNEEKNDKNNKNFTRKSNMIENKTGDNDENDTLIVY